MQSSRRSTSAAFHCGLGTRPRRYPICEESSQQCESWNLVWHKGGRFGRRRCSCWSSRRRWSGGRGWSRHPVGEAVVVGAAVVSAFRDGATVVVAMAAATAAIVVVPE